jgi:hypothetical protein
MKHAMVILLLALAGGGCNQTVACPGGPSRRTLFRQELTGRDAIVFRSHNGKAYRRDSDTELVFYRNHDAVILDYGIAGEAFRGRYHLVNDDGYIVVWFKDFRSEWPVMRVDRDGDALILRPLHPPNGLAPFDPSATTQPAERNYWQFRMLDASQTAEALATAKKWLGE